MKMGAVYDTLLLAERPFRGRQSLERKARQSA
jgi:hypothetical protein